MGSALAALAAVAQSISMLLFAPKAPLDRVVDALCRACVAARAPLPTTSCNVVVRRVDHGPVFIECMDPTLLGTPMINAELALASRIRRRLRWAIGWI
ncbi:hypothetical protein [Peristeroidobacter soli]|uniref:hypothetical protein n=1 Tax=Peristeroidobacter soli TaxID=2497877 RepID=UPI00101CFDA7|nr:hypothetical protein [Peristeroidobacter soli]